MRVFLDTKSREESAVIFTGTSVYTVVALNGWCVVDFKLEMSVGFLGVLLRHGIIGIVACKSIWVIFKDSQCNPHICSLTSSIGCAG